MRSREGGGFDIREEIEPVFTDDDQPEDVNELIGIFLGGDTQLRLNTASTSNPDSVRGATKRQKTGSTREDGC